MTDIDLIKQALEYLEDNQHHIADNERHAYVMLYNDCITALKARLAQETALQALHNENKRLGLYKDAYAEPEQEPVAWGVFEGNLHDVFFSQEEAQKMADLKGTHAEVRPLYAPPQRTWVGMTKEERHEISLSKKPYVADIMAAHEEELKRRNE